MYILCRSITSYVRTIGTQRRQKRSGRTPRGIKCNETHQAMKNVEISTLDISSKPSHSASHCRFFLYAAYCICIFFSLLKRSALTWRSTLPNAIRLSSADLGVQLLFLFSFVPSKLYFSSFPQRHIPPSAQLLEPFLVTYLYLLPKIVQPNGVPCSSSLPNVSAPIRSCISYDCSFHISVSISLYFPIADTYCIVVCCYARLSLWT